VDTGCITNPLRHRRLATGTMNTGMKVRHPVTGVTALLGTGAMGHRDTGVKGHLPVAGKARAT